MNEVVEKLTQAGYIIIIDRSTSDRERGFYRVKLRAVEAPRDDVGKGTASTLLGAFTEAMGGLTAQLDADVERAVAIREAVRL